MQSITFISLDMVVLLVCMAEVAFCQNVYIWSHYVCMDMCLGLYAHVSTKYICLYTLCDYMFNAYLFLGTCTLYH